MTQRYLPRLKADASKGPVNRHFGRILWNGAVTIVKRQEGLNVRPNLGGNAARPSLISRTGI